MLLRHKKKDNQQISLKMKYQYYEEYAISVNKQ